MKGTRYYEVRVVVKKKDDDGTIQHEQVFLVEAGSQSAAERHVGKKFIQPTTKIADAKRVAELMGRGIKPEAASEAS